jgi:hypothetical protein
MSVVVNPYAGPPAAPARPPTGAQLVGLFGQWPRGRGG